jgi:hypothetical protein
METLFVRKILLPAILFVALVLAGVLIFAIFQEIFTSF